MTILLAQPHCQAAEIPDGVADIQAFRQWAASDDFPQSGSYSHLGGKLWVDTNMEQFAHNQVKGAFAAVLSGLTKATGRYFHDRMLLTNIDAGLSTEPDGMFVSHEAFATGRARLEKGSESVELLGSPDIVIEVVSRTSRKKDRAVLPELYHKAGIAEYWIAEPNLKKVNLEIFTFAATGYIPTSNVGGWVESRLFQKQFRFEVTADPAGLEVYDLQVR